MTPTIQRLRVEQHATIGELIEGSVEEIVARWVERSMQEQSSAARVHHDVLVDHLPEFLTKLGQSLSAAGDGSKSPREQAKEHGDQRWDNGWSITEVVRDYQILRLVLIEFLEKTVAARLSIREMLVLNVAINDAIAAAVSSFAASQAMPGTSTNTTRSEGIDLLLNVLGVVGHELRNPLAPLTNSLEILRLSGTDPVQIENARQMMVRQIHVLGRLVEDLMDLPRLAHGKMSLVRERLDLARLVRTCAEDRRKGFEEGGLTLEVKIPPGPVWMDGDETRLIQALGNLMGNALKFTNRGGTVTICLDRVTSARASVSVQDTGIGIDPALLPKVFEAYTQAEQAVVRNRGGLGLGLALVKGVVELHGGTVVASSGGPSKGSTFTMELPLCDALAHGFSGQVADVTAPVKPRRVLIIEDNLDSAESLKVYLEIHGHSVSIANSGSDGLNLAATFKPEVVICDIGLPGMDGYAVAAELRQSLQPPPALVIAISGHGSRKGPDGEPDQAFDYYLLKPADPARVARLLAVDRSTG